MIGSHSFDITGREWSLENIFQPIIEELLSYLCLSFALKDFSYEMDSFVVAEKSKSEIRQEANRVFVNSSIRAFLQDVRRHCLHGNPAFPGFTTSSHRDEKNQIIDDNRFCYSKESLMKEDGWKSLSRDYIASWNGEERLSSIIEEFTGMVNGYSNWLLRYFDELFAPDYMATDRLIKQWGDSFK